MITQQKIKNPFTVSLVDNSDNNDLNSHFNI